MAIRCFGRAGFFAVVLAVVARAFDFTALRAEGRAADLAPLRFFIAVWAALRDFVVLLAFLLVFLAMGRLPVVMMEASTETVFVGWKKPNVVRLRVRSEKDGGHGASA